MANTHSDHDDEETLEEEKKVGEMIFRTCCPTLYIYNVFVLTRMHGLSNSGL